MNIGSNYNYITLIFRMLCLPLFVMGCFHRRKLSFRKVFAIFYTTLNVFELVGTIVMMYYIWNYTDKIGEACDKAIEKQAEEIEEHETSTG